MLVGLRFLGGYDLHVIDGIVEYNDLHGPWEICYDPMARDLAHLLQRHPDAHGLIARPSYAAHIDEFRDVKVPTVLLADEACDLQWPRVGPDDFAVGRMAFEHFEMLHLRQVAFCGPQTRYFATQRLAGLMHGAEAADVPCHVFPEHAYAGFSHREELANRFGQWLRQLPKPVGLLAVSDLLANELSRLCRRFNIPVPGQVALLGVDNDPVQCTTALPQLSSIDHGARCIGREAAGLLSRLMCGDSVAAEARTVPPLEVVVRESTDMLSVDDPILARAVRFIRRHVADGVQVDDIVRRMPISRRALERKFSACLGRTIYQEILHARIERAKHLLINTDMPLPEVSAHCGFSYASKLSEVFRRIVGEPPSRFRQRRQTRRNLIGHLTLSASRTGGTIDRPRHER